MTAPMHTHPCQSCGASVECDDDLARNHDGFPEVICPSFHAIDGGLVPTWQCLGCAMGADAPACECGEPATTTFDEGPDFAFWMSPQPRLTPVCAACKTERENREPAGSE